MRLFARLSFDEVTVGDIADAAEMTPAAVYYHFAGKEQILLEGTRMFTDELVECARQGVDFNIPVDELMASLLQLIGKRRTFATVYFVGRRASTRHSRRTARRFAPTSRMCSWMRLASRAASCRLPKQE